MGRRLSQSSLPRSGLRTQGGPSARSQRDSSPLSSLILNADGLDLHLCLTCATLTKKTNKNKPKMYKGGIKPGCGRGTDIVVQSR